MVSLEQFYLIWLGLYAVALAAVGRGHGKGYARAEKLMAFVTFAACMASLSMWAIARLMRGLCPRGAVGASCT